MARPHPPARERAPRRRRPRAGFTLVEMVVVVAIVGILAAAAGPVLALAARRQKEFELRRDLRMLRTAIDAYHQAAADGRIRADAENPDGYPPSLEVLVDGVPDARLRNHTLYFLRALPRDPFADPAVPAARTWGLRCYDSPPEAPREGRDVFDVHSLADGAGLDRTPYRQW
jgi:general secretion pathway protein G